MVGRHHQLNRMNSGTLQEMVRDREAWCATVPGGSKESETAWRLNNNNVISEDRGNG